MKFIPTRALAVSGAALATAAAMLLIPTSPAAAAKPQVTITSGPTVNADNSVSLGYSINRWPRAIRSRVCTVDTATTHAFVSCGALTKPAANPTRAQVTLTGLADGTYTFTVRVRFKDGRHAAATSAPFTIDTFTDPIGACWDDTLADSTNYSDVLYNGPINTLGNARITNSFDGTCALLAPLGATIVQAPPDDQGAADDLCASLGAVGVLDDGTLNSLGYAAAPADFWPCSASTPIP